MRAPARHRSFSTTRARTPPDDFRVKVFQPVTGVPPHLPEVLQSGSLVAPKFTQNDAM
jgi:hypothetical protein